VPAALVAATAANDDDADAKEGAAAAAAYDAVEATLGLKPKGLRLHTLLRLRLHGGFC